MSGNGTVTGNDITQMRHFREWVYYNYTSHEAAKQHFKRHGMGDVSIIPEWNSTQLKAAMQTRLDSVEAGVKVIDATSQMPTACKGDLGQAVKRMTEMKDACKRNHKAMVVYQRTADNTPAFVHMLAYGARLHAAIAGQDDKLNDCSYGAVVLFRGAEITLPARLCVGSADLAADVLITNADVHYFGFKCVICQRGFSEWDTVAGNPVRGLTEMLITDCDHVMHSRCMMQRVAEQRPGCDKCPKCGDQLPWATYQSEEDEAAGVAAAAAEGRPSHYIGNVYDAAAAKAAADRASRASPFMAEMRSHYNCQSLRNLGADVQECALPPLGPA